MDFKQSVISDSCFKVFLQQGQELQASYDYGISLARHLRGLFIEAQKISGSSFQEMKITFGKAVVTALPKLTKQYREKATTHLILDLISNELPIGLVKADPVKPMRCR